MTDDGWFVTGDAVTIGPDGFHRIVGRASIDIIKTGGFKVGAGEVEAALLSHPSVDEAAVVGAPDDDLGRADRRLRRRRRRRPRDAGRPRRPPALGPQAPARDPVVERLPRNAMGKVQKQQLR